MELEGDCADSADVAPTCRSPGSELVLSDDWLCPGVAVTVSAPLEMT